ncbi:formate/nitrite transporter family protein [Aliiroseovarius sp. S1339]|uniref:formate/nitrite transporter family protein n=1 Tax=Aliiroseovarius sp. S1339 TaxID=2936990 RepID=UPI0020C15598|nr:formate/nitrite transporter family protein [Aliiroseovarius sp. S1339]MCK8463192.1 formate/nitrite transporter family protein [Aliiroseovarius sp. S1339]
MTEEEKVEEQAIEDASKLTAKTVYEVIRRSGDEELERSNGSLFWSGVSAGIVISFSVLGEAVLRSYLPDANYSYLIENLGYSLGFVMVIIGRMQLFTENTITTVLPYLHAPSWSVFNRIIILWSIVLLANVIGAFAIATFYAHSGAISADILPAIEELSRHATGMPAAESFARAIPAGILVAAIVWMLPEAGASSVSIIVMFTWLIAAGDFTHIVAGSVEMAFLMVTGELALGQALFGFFLPVLAGNVVGGTAIFAMLAWGQVRRDID